MTTGAEEVVAEALREWQRNLGSPLAPTTLWIDRAEVPAKVVLDALRAMPVHQRMWAMGMSERCHEDVTVEDCPLWTETPDPLAGPQ